MQSIGADSGTDQRFEIIFRSPLGKSLSNLIFVPAVNGGDVSGVVTELRDGERSHGLTGVKQIVLGTGENKFTFGSNRISNN